MSKKCFGFLHLATNLAKNNETELVLFKTESLHPHLTPSFTFQCRDHLNGPLQHDFKFKPLVGSASDTSDSSRIHTFKKIHIIAL